MNPQPSSPLIDSSLPQNDGVLLSMNQVAAMLAARRRLIVFILAAIVLCTGAVLILLPRTWTASTDVFVDYRENDPISGRTFSALLDDSYMQTQIDLLKSERVASQAADALGWRSTADYADAVAREGRTATDTVMIEGVTRNTTVTSARGSRVLTVSFSAGTPEAARDMANAIVAAYLTITQEMARSSARSRSEQYTVQIEQMRREADAIQEALTHYLQQTNIVSTTEDTDVDMRQLQALNALLVETRNRRQGAEATAARVRELNGRGIDIAQLPEIAQLPSLQNLKDKINDAERRLGEVSGQYGPNHPIRRGLADERVQLQARLEREAQAALSGIDLDATRLRAQEKALAQDVSALETKILHDKVHRDRIAAYRRQLSSVEQVYNAALQKYDGLIMASNITQPNLSVLRAAEAPTKPSAPRMMQSLLASVVVGLMFGLCMALVLELAVRRVRCADDMRRGFDLPMLGSIGLASSADAGEQGS